MAHTLPDRRVPAGWGSGICALTEAKWNLLALTRRDANANNMLDMLDLRHPAFLTPPALAKPLVETDPGALA